MRRRQITLLLLGLLTVILCVRGSNIGATRQDISLSDDGGYTDILIAIHSSVHEDSSLIDDIKDKFTKASAVLFDATNGNLYFRNISVLIPASWDTDPSYSTADDESFNRARVVVGPENPAWGSTPYTLQPGLCGTEADYIHLTTQYLSQQALGTEKRLIREFAHLRWGVFDEDVPETDTISPRFYAFNRAIYPSKCTQDIFGTILDLTQPGFSCMLDSNTMLPTSTCQFSPSQQTSVPASLMYAEYLDSVTQFCNKSSSVTNGDTEHDSLAPNRQNRICGQSVWETMSAHPDYDISYANLRTPGAPPDPVFEILYPKPASSGYSPFPTTTASVGGGGGLVVNTSVTSEGVIECEPELVCLTLDVSGSMGSYSRVDKMRSAVQNYLLNYLPVDTIVALTTFQSYAITLANMTVITGDDIRNDLADLLQPIYASGGTNIGAGMHQCLEILRDYSNYSGIESIEKSRILVLSDGVGSIGSLDQLVDEGVLVDTIAYSQAASSSLSYISDTTGGLKYFTGDNDAAVGLNDALLATIERDCESGIVTLVNEQVTLAYGDNSITQTIYIDSTLGDDTKLVFSYTVDINVNISTPNDNNYTITKNSVMKIITVDIHGEVTGLVTYVIQRAGSSYWTEDITITITSQPIEGVDSLGVTYRTESTNMYFSTDMLVTGYVEIFQSLTPVLKLNVTVVITTPGSSELMISYTDDGIGADSTPDDGIYTGVLTAHQMDSSGYYNIRVLISGEGFLPAAPDENRRKRRSVSNSLGIINRATSGGYLDISNVYVNNGTDNIPPGKISDFHLVAARSAENSFTLGWTSPGDDYFTGTVTDYHLLISNQQDISSFVHLPSEAVINNISDFLQPASSQVQLSINIGQVNNTLFGVSESDDIDTYFFIIRGIDDHNNVGDWSHTVSASFVDPVWFSWPILVGVLPNGTDVYALRSVSPTTTTEPPTTDPATTEITTTEITTTEITTTEGSSTETPTTGSSTSLDIVSPDIISTDTTPDSGTTTTADSTSTADSTTTTESFTTSVDESQTAGNPEKLMSEEEKVVAGVTPSLTLLLLALLLGLLFFLKLKKRKIHHQDDCEYLDQYLEDGEDVPSSPPRSTDFSMEGTVDWSSSTTKPKKKRLPRVKRKGKKVAPLPMNDENASVDTAS